MDIDGGLETLVEVSQNFWQFVEVFSPNNWYFFKIFEIFPPRSLQNHFLLHFYQQKSQKYSKKSKNYFWCLHCR